MLAILFILFKFTLCNCLMFGTCLLLTQLIYLKNLAYKKKILTNGKIISFIHPFCSDCGGGEKVLWRMLISMIQKPNQQLENQSIRIKILAGVSETAEEINTKLNARFGIDFFSMKQSSNVVDIEIVRLKTAYLLKPKEFATMLFQIIGQIAFAFEIICKCYSDVYIDTTGLPFTYFVLSLFGHGRVSAYVHYPFISYDMIRDVQREIAGVHSRGFMTKYLLFKKFKLLYYKIVLWLYRLSGAFVSYAQCNSSWTYNHIKSIWSNTTLDKLYPPCSTHIYEKCFPNKNRENIIVSFAQFRPEKDQRMQIRIMQQLRQKKYLSDLQLHIIGAVRDENDQLFFNELQREIQQMGLSEYVKLIPNAPISEVISEFSKAKIGIHTMRDEHFGISIIEMMASGLIVITHNSAGAQHDIIGPSQKTVGILVENEEDYVEQISKIIQNYSNLGQIPVNALQQSMQFSDEAFMEQFRDKLVQMIN